MDPGKILQNAHMNRHSQPNLGLCSNLRQIPVLQYVTKCPVKGTEYHNFRTLLKHGIV